MSDGLSSHIETLFKLMRRLRGERPQEDLPRRPAPGLEAGDEWDILRDEYNFEEGERAQVVKEGKCQYPFYGAHGMLLKAYTVKATYP